MPSFASLAQSFPKVKVPMHMHSARAYKQCIITALVMHQRIALVELYQYAKFCVASSKFPESKGAYAYAWCTYVARALCTPSRNGMYHRITLIEFYQCTKFGVDSSKFPRTGGPLSNKLFRSCRAQPAPHTNVNHKNIYAGEECM